MPVFQRNFEKSDALRLRSYQGLRKVEKLTEVNLLGERGGGGATSSSWVVNKKIQVNLKRS